MKKKVTVLALLIVATALFAQEAQEAQNTQETPETQTSNEQASFEQAYMQAMQGGQDISTKTVLDTLTDFNVDLSARAKAKMFIPSMKTSGYEYGITGTKGNLDIVTKMVIPNNMGSSTIVEIGDKVFEECPALVSVELSRNIDTIGEGTFAKCEALVEVTFAKESRNTKKTQAESMELKDEAFLGCKALKGIAFSDNLKKIEIGKKCFNDCLALETITFPDDAKVSIAKGAFDGCKSLSSESKAKLKALKYKGKL